MVGIVSSIIRNLHIDIGSHLRGLSEPYLKKKAGLGFFRVDGTVTAVIIFNSMNHGLIILGMKRELAEL